MSTDLRQQKKDVAAAKAAALAAQSTANTALATGQTAQSDAAAVAAAVQVVSGTVQTVSAEMVRKFTSAPIPATSFVLDAIRGYYYATVSHMLGDAAPDVEVYDNDKDKQRIQSIILDNNTIELELDADDMATNSFPLTCICLGKNTPVQPVVIEDEGTLIPTTNFYVKREGGQVKVRAIGSTEWDNFGNTSDIARIKVMLTGSIFYRTSTDPKSYFMANVVDNIVMPVTEASYDAASATAGVISI